MKQKIFLTTFILVFGIYILMTFKYIYQQTRIQENIKKVSPTYVFMGNVNISTGPRFLENEDSCIFGDKGLANRPGVYNREKGLVSSPTVAYAIANAILTSLFGEKNMNEQRPLSIDLVNNKYWLIQGNYKPKTPNTTGGSPIIIIKKDDAQIQLLMHTK